MNRYLMIVLIMIQFLNYAKIFLIYHVFQKKVPVKCIQVIRLHFTFVKKKKAPFKTDDYKCVFWTHSPCFFQKEHFRQLSHSFLMKHFLYRARHQSWTVRKMNGSRASLWFPLIAFFQSPETPLLFGPLRQTGANRQFRMAKKHDLLHRFREKKA